MNMNGYTRWTGRAGSPVRRADLLGSAFIVETDASANDVVLTLAERQITLSPDEARMLGVRLIEGAVHADPGAVRIDAS